MSEYVLIHNTALAGCITEIRSKPLDGSFEVIIRETRGSKTLAQLGGLFGVWTEYISKEIGESQKYLHKKWKADFLSRIYISDHCDSDEKTTDDVDAWCELLYHYQQSEQTEKMTIHAKRISLKWATIKQMKKYMSVIDEHYMAEGYPLPILDKYNKHYKRK